MTSRARETEIAELLRLIAERPQERSLRNAGDLEGEFDLWFDGGALRFVTGSTEYHFVNGSQARVLVSPQTLQVTLQLEDGTVVSVSQA